MLSNASFQKNERTSSFAIGHDAGNLTQIFDDAINVAVWRRNLGDAIRRSAARLALIPNHSLQKVIETTDLRSHVRANFPADACDAFIDDVLLLADMFATLTDARSIGLRMASVDKAMCPRFHVDRVVMRLITTYQGGGSQWLDNRDVNRSRLGQVSKGFDDADSGIMKAGSTLWHSNEGDVLLLKGELWNGNENRGAVHRSPSVPSGEQRLVLTMDIVGS